MPHDNPNNDTNDVEGEFIIAHGASAQKARSHEPSTTDDPGRPAADDSPDSPDATEGEIFLHDPPPQKQQPQRARSPHDKPTNPTDNKSAEVVAADSPSDSSAVPKLHPFNFRPDEEESPAVETPDDATKPIASPAPESTNPGQTTVYDDVLLDEQLASQEAARKTRRKVVQIAAALVAVVVLIAVAVLATHLIGSKKPAKNNTVTKTAAGSNSHQSQPSTTSNAQSPPSSNTSSSSSTNNYVTTSFTNNGYTYSVLFDKAATVVTSGGVEHLSGYDLPHKVMLVVIAYLNPYQSCATEYPTAVIVFSATIQGKAYPVCADVERDTMFANFKYNNVWQRIAIYSAGQTSPVDTTTAETIFNSLTVK